MTSEIVEPKEALALTLPEPAEILNLDNPSGDVVVLARNPEEMVSAQQGLVDWATRKVAFEKQELTEAEQNLATAKSLKHRTAGWARQVKLARTRVIYYEKVLAALNHGFCIVPNFPIQIIATRTSTNPRAERKRHQSQPNDIPHEQLPVGKGQYVNPTPAFYNGWEDRALPDGRKDTVRYVQTTGEHNPVDFPFKLVKPQVLKDLEKTMLLKLFDDIGVLPQVERRRRPDPMIVGRIRRQDRGGGTTTMSFLITWWIDSRDL